MSDLDIDALILSEHDAFRRAFQEIDKLTDEGELTRRWTSLAEELEVHASGEEEVFYEELLHEVPGSEDDTEHAVRDHNKIRVAVKACGDHPVGSEPWWAAFRDARAETFDHLAEEERDVLPPFRDGVDDGRRGELGERWLAYLERHAAARGLSGEEKDPQAYVEQHG
jgi:hypothetical protein